MNKYRSLPGLIFVFLLITSCEEAPEPSDPCEDNEWATAFKNSEEHCMGNVEVTYWNANTQDAKIIMTAGNELIAPYEINATFRIPVEGVELNKAYPVLEGKLFGADPITEGSMTLLVFDPPTQGKAGCIAGIFSLKAQTGGITTFDYTNGRFAYFKGAGTGPTGSTEFCNPF